MADGDPANWQLTLKKLYDDPGIQTYLPGHGPVCQKQGVKDLQIYFAKMQDMSLAANTDSLQSRLLMQPPPAPYQSWYFNRFYEQNMKFLFSRNKNATAKQ